jgi:hypothetical protein
MLKMTSQSDRRKWIVGVLDTFYREHVKLKESKGGENCIMRNVFVCDVGCDVV